MPSLVVPMEQIADAVFVAQRKMLPPDWQQPQGQAGDQYRDAFEPSEHMAVPQPMCYFWAASTNKLHVDAAKDIGGSMKSFCHDMLGGFKKALDLWRAQAKFQNLRIMAVSAIGSPGCLSGSSIESNIKNFSLPTASGNEKKWRDAVAKGLADSFKSWQDGVMIPGLPFYPAFAAFPGPYGPPMPNVPFPLITCPSSGLAKMTPATLKQAMCSNFSLDDPDDQFGALAQAIGTAVAAAFLAWLPMQQIMMVMGKGSIPTFAPPWVPVGPVIAGDNIATPGHLSV